MENGTLETIYTEELYRLPEKITIVITQSWESLTAEEKVQLKKITDVLRDKISPKLSLDAFQVTSVLTLDLSTWLTRPPILIYFGPSIKGLTNYEVIEADTTKMVLAESLGELVTNNAAKTKLWQALQLLFTH